MPVTANTASTSPLFGAKSITSSGQRFKFQFHFVLTVTQIPEGRKKQSKETTAGRNCTACKKPMKGHHNVVDCSKNKDKKKTKK